MQVRADGYIEKAAGLADGQVEVVVSTNAIDAHGERINVAGIDIKDFKKNPVVLWGHDGFNLPIAKAIKVWTENNKLMARVQFYLKDAFAAKIYGYIVDGYLNAVSIGGMVQEWGADGLTIEKLLMKEFSFVSIPANQEALVTAKSMTGDQKAELRALGNAFARKMLSKDSGMTDIRDNIETLETLVATLKEVAYGEPDGVQADEKTTMRVVLRTAQAVDKQAEVVIKRVKLQGDINE